MTELSISRTNVEGFEAVVVDTGVLRFSLIPALGGKIASLRDLRTGREWLWRNPRLPYRASDPAASYVATADTGGWDECFPSVAPCQYPAEPWTGRGIPDHGELWAQAAALAIVEAPDKARLQTTWEGLALPYRFERDIDVTAGSARLRVEYTVGNTGDDLLDFIWSIHPLLAIEPSMALRLPPEARYHVWSSTPDGALPEDDVRFPLTFNGHDLGTLPGPEAAIALKLWSDPLAEGQGWAALEARDGALRMRWDPARLPQVGFWMNLGAWAGDGGAPYYNLGLEPCLGAQDSLAEAVQRHNLFAQLPPGGTRAWGLEIELTA